MKNLLVLLAASLVWTSAATAQVVVRKNQGSPPAVSPERAAAVLDGFERELRLIDRMILDGKYAKGYKKVSSLLDEMTDRIISGTGTEWYLGTATVLRAVTAHGLGREAEALWHWHIATQIFPDATDLDLSPYGRAGVFLSENVLAEKTEPAVDAGKNDDGSEDHIEPPVKKNTPTPRFPAAKRGAPRVAVIVSAIIGKDGRPRAPRILDAQGELTLVCAALDALRRWKFEPAKRNGEPVEVYYNLTMGFGSRSTSTGMPRR